MPLGGARHIEAREATGSGDTCFSPNISTVLQAVLQPPRARHLSPGYTGKHLFSATKDPLDSEVHSESQSPRGQEARLTNAMLCS